MSRALVIAKAPVVGRVKTRLGASVGMQAAAALAAAALLDTLEACAATFDECHLALDGDLDRAVGADRIRVALTTWRIHPQRGATFAERLAHAHADAGRSGETTVQLGMDTPQVTPELLREVAEAAAGGDAVLGPATDGGWWVLALGDPGAAAALIGVPMSTPQTYDLTHRALTDAGQTVKPAPDLTDVDTLADAETVAAGLDDGHFLRAWRELGR